jgi:hypothetical protein
MVIVLIKWLMVGPRSEKMAEWNYGVTSRTGRIIPQVEWLAGMPTI